MKLLDAETNIEKTRVIEREQAREKQREKEPSSKSKSKLIVVAYGIQMTES